MTDIATLGFAIPTAPLVAASSALNNVAAAATSVSAATSPAVAGINAVGAAAKATAVAATAQASALNVSAAAHKGHGAAANNNAIATLELFHVTRSLTEQFAMGVSPLRALTMEMGRIMTLFQFAGGPSGVLSLFGTMLGKLLNPIALVGGGLAGIGAIGAAAFFSWEGHLEKMQASLNGLGRTTGLTLNGLERIADAGAKAGNLSTDSAMDLAAQFAGTGKIGPDMIGQLIGTTKSFATATGQSVAQAGTDLAKAFSDPAKGADELNAKLGLLDDRTRQTIIDFEKSGQTLDAQGVLLRTLQNNISTTTDLTWTWSRAWGAVGTAASDALAAIGRAEQHAFDPTLEERLQAAQNPNSSVSPQMWAKFFGRFGQAAATSGHSTGLLQLLQGRQQSSLPEADDLNEQVRRQNALASQQGAAVATNLQSISSAKIIDSVNTETSAYRDLTDRLAELSGVSTETVSKLAGGVDVYGRLVTGAQLYTQTVGQLTHAHDTFITSFQREIAAGQIEIESIGARTLAEKAAVDVARERLALMGQQITASEAQAKVDQKLNEVLAGANKQVADNSRSVANAAATAGLSGLALQKAQLDQEYKLLLEQAGTSHTITMQVPATPVPVAAVSAGAVSAAQSDAARLAAGKSFPAGALGPNANGPNSAFGDLSKSVGGVGSAASSAAPAMQTYTKTIVDGGNASQIAAGKAQKWATIVENATKPTIDNATKSLNAQGKMLDVQIATFGQSTGAIAAATEKQQLLNQFAAEGVTEAMIGAPAYAALTKAIDGVATKAGMAATASEAFAEKQKSVIGTMDLMRSASSGFLSTFVDDAVNGKNAIQSLQDAVKSFTSDVLRFAENNLISGLFGQSGTTGANSLAGGGIAGWLGKLVGLGGGAPASAASSGTGLIGGLNFATAALAGGGVMTSRGLMPLRRYASGGVAASPQLAMFGEGSSPEAYVPLPDGRSIPVNVRGSGPRSGSGGVVVNISNNHPGAAVSASPTTGANGQQQIQVMVEQIVAKSVSKNGLVGRTMQRQYGLGRLAGARP